MNFVTLAPLPPISKSLLLKGAISVIYFRGSTSVICERFCNTDQKQLKNDELSLQKIKKKLKDGLIIFKLLMLQKEKTEKMSNSPFLVFF